MQDSITPLWNGMRIEGVLANHSSDRTGAAYIDRVNISFASLQMNRDSHFTATVYGFGAGLFFSSYAACEIPSNLLLCRFGARRWLARIMVTWGLVATGMMFVRLRQGPHRQRPTGFVSSNPFSAADEPSGPAPADRSDSRAVVSARRLVYRSMRPASVEPRVDHAFGRDPILHLLTGRESAPLGAKIRLSSHHLPPNFRVDPRGRGRRRFRFQGCRRGIVRPFGCRSLLRPSLHSFLAPGLLTRGLALRHHASTSCTP